MATNLTNSDYPFNWAALKAMVHYVTRRYAMSPEKLGAVKLHKILWFTEIAAVRKTGKSITGETFIKHDFGPFSTHLENIVAELKREGNLTVQPGEDDSESTLFVGKGFPDQDSLTDEQWRLLERWMENVVENHSATSISDLSHDELWEATEPYQPMSLDAAALRFVKPPKHVEAEIAKRIAALK
ncbi:MAG: Panacea domain-containing protein [Gammaproteobacteria bacterium]